MEWPQGSGEGISIKDGNISKQDVFSFAILAQLIRGEMVGGNN